ncbi:hypothetical protein QQ008_28040 [Fulvivirgaceae bacterium BMA10]|uniref:Uncharacterized protein n=1 Tax=Splendidivirga corallicola TaxID=3051826 RepID=A0ABT8KWW2_9BACT|nr:hypothetical protein [Fulvivirgaceae bacterium BMA10]
MNKNPIYLLIVIGLFTGLSSCGCPEIFQSASCIAPPEGIFQANKINIALYETIAADSGTYFSPWQPLDGNIIIDTDKGQNIIGDFYKWHSFEESIVFKSAEFILDDKTETIPFESFVFPEGQDNFSKGGYTCLILNRDQSFVIIVEKLTEQFINGECNDTVVITDCD